MLTAILIDKNLVMWTHLIARRLGNILFTLGSFVPCYNIGFLLLWKKDGALSKGKGSS